MRNIINLFRKKRPSFRKSKSLGDFVWFIYYSIKEKNALWNFVMDNRNPCDTLQMPSRKIIKKYGLNLDQCNTELWGILEKYYNGTLVEKKKDES